MCAAPKIASGPFTSKTARGYDILFKVDQPCDVTVRIVNGRGEVVRRLVSGMVGRDRAGLSRLWHEILPRRPLRVRVLPEEGGVLALLEAAHQEGATLFVAAATQDVLQPATLQALRERLRCPICLVRKWGGEPG